MSTVPELPDELHELIAQYNRRLISGFFIQWIKQGNIFQIVIYHEIHFNSLKESFKDIEFVKNELEKIIEITPSLSTSLPFSINRLNEAAKNWQIRFEMNEATRRIGSDLFCSIAKDVTERVAKRCNHTIVDVTEKLIMQINTHLTEFHISEKTQGEVPCKAYRVQ